MSTLSTRLHSVAAGFALVAGTASGSLAGALSAHATGAPRCTNADLHASYRVGGGAAGTSYGWIVLTNTSGHACETGGYGGISLVGDGNGTQIGAPAVRVDQSRVGQYVVQPGRRLRSRVGVTEALNYPKTRCHPAHADGFRVYVPDSFVSQYVAHRTTGCRNHAVKLIHQEPLGRP